MRFPHSLFSTIVLWYTLCVTVVFAIYTWLLNDEIQRGRRRSFDALLAARASLLGERLYHEGDRIEDDAARVGPSEPETDITKAAFAVYTTNWQPLLVSFPWRNIRWTTNTEHYAKLERRLAAGVAHYGFVRDQRNEEFRFAAVRESVKPLPALMGNRTDTMTRLPVNIVYASWFTPVGDSLDAQTHRMIAAVVLIWCVILGAGIAVARRGLRPVERLADAAASIRPEDPHSRLPAREMPVELMHLARQINEAFDRLDTALAAEKKFTAAAAHELRSPLAGIASRVDSLARHTGLGDAARADVERLGAEIDRLKLLSGQLLLLARLDRAAAGEAFQKKPLDMAELANDAVDFCREKAEAARVMLSMECFGNAFVLGHEEWMLRALYNVIENAVKYSPENTAVHVRVEPTADAKRILVSVADQGPGIPRDDRHKVFERFYRGADAAGCEGTGLGLAIVMDVVRAHRGEVFVSDGPEGKGACVTLIFPRE